MKKNLLLIAALFAFGNLWAQNFVPRDSWPYLYEDFTGGAASAGSEDKVSSSLFNISVYDGALYYIDSNGVTMKADMMRVNSVRIDSDVFLNISGKMYQIVYSSANGLILKERTADLDALAKVNIGYGVSSSTASAENVAILMAGRMSSFRQALALSKAEKEAGSEIPLKETVYLYIHNKLIPSQRSAIMSIPEVNKSELKALIKAEKIHWNDPVSLIPLLNYLSNNGQ